MIDGDTVDEELRAIEELFNVSLTFDKADQEELKAYVQGLRERGPCGDHHTESKGGN